LPEENAREENGISNRQLSTTFIPPLTPLGDHVVGQALYPSQLSARIGLIEQSLFRLQRIVLPAVIHVPTFWEQMDT
jgi:hypothetical protein